jgi:hypothetical protein
MQSATEGNVVSRLHLLAGGSKKQKTAIGTGEIVNI